MTDALDMMKAFLEKKLKKHILKREHFLFEQFVIVLSQ